MQQQQFRAPDGYQSPGNLSTGTGAQQQAVASAMSEWGWLGSNNAKGGILPTRDVTLLPRRKQVRRLPRRPAPPRARARAFLLQSPDLANPPTTPLLMLYFPPNHARSPHCPPRQSLGLQLSTQKAPAGNTYVHFVAIVEPDSVADNAGLRVGEQLIHLSGTSVRTSNHKQLMSILKQTRKQHRSVTLGLAVSSDLPASVGGAINTPGGTSRKFSSGLTGRISGHAVPKVFIPHGSFGHPPTLGRQAQSAWNGTPSNAAFGTLCPWLWPNDGMGGSSTCACILPAVPSLSQLPLAVISI